MAVLMSLQEIKTHVELEYSTQRNQAFFNTFKNSKATKNPSIFSNAPESEKAWRKTEKLRHFEKKCQAFWLQNSISQ